MRFSTSFSGAKSIIGKAIKIHRRFKGDNHWIVKVGKNYCLTEIPFGIKIKRKMLLPLYHNKEKKNYVAWCSLVHYYYEKTGVSCNQTLVNLN